MIGLTLHCTAFFRLISADLGACWQPTAALAKTLQEVRCSQKRGHVLIDNLLTTLYSLRKRRSS